MNTIKKLFLKLMRKFKKLIKSFSKLGLIAANRRKINFCCLYGGQLLWPATYSLNMNIVRVAKIIDKTKIRLKLLSFKNLIYCNETPLPGSQVSSRSKGESRMIAGRPSLQSSKIVV